MQIWGHRGCSQLYPENTLLSFEKAMNVPGITGIELDVQLTRDDKLVVIHDETVDRTTDGFGFVRDYTLGELKALHIFGGKGTTSEKIPTFEEVLDLLKPKFKDGLLLNVELKTSIYHYQGIEAKVVDMTHQMDVADSIVYSSFWAESLVKVHEVEPSAKFGVLDGALSNCLYKAIGLESMWSDVPKGSIALHPGGNCLDLPKEKFQGRAVRAYFGGHLFPERPTGGKLDVEKFAAAGVTDLFLNEPDKYL